MQLVGTGKFIGNQEIMRLADTVESYTSHSFTKGRENLTDSELLSIVGSEFRIAKGEIASYKLKEQSYGPVTRWFLKHFSKY